MCGQFPSWWSPESSGEPLLSGVVVDGVVVLDCAYA